MDFLLHSMLPCMPLFPHFGYIWNNTLELIRIAIGSVCSELLCPLVLPFVLVKVWKLVLLMALPACFPSQHSSPSVRTPRCHEVSTCKT